jgi:AraC-like DNA-binding protein
MPCRSLPLGNQPTLETGDLDIVKATAKTVLGEVAIDADPRILFHIQQAVYGRLTIVGYQWDCRAFAHTESSPCTYNLVVPFRGAVDLSVDGKRLAATPARPVLIAPASEMTFSMAPSSVLVFYLEAQRVHDWFSRHGLPKPSAQSSMLDGRIGMHMIQQALHLKQTLLRSRPPGPLGLPIREMVVVAKRRLIAAIGEFLGGMPLELQTRASCQHVMLEDLLSWLAAHSSEPLGASDLEAHTGLTIRAIEQAFARNLGCTPMEHLHSLRLEKAQELLMAPAHDGSVTSIALAAGFNHLGRFSHDYAKRFGERPSETLKRCR